MSRRVFRSRPAQVLGLVVVLLVAWLRFESDVGVDGDAGRGTTSGQTPLTPGPVERAFEGRQSDLQVTERGRVVRVLDDDREGSRHQRFIVELDSGITVLIAHNIDIAPRVRDLEVGESIVFHGEYEWNDLGGVIHWTHHDPEGIHEDGWLEHAGVRYD